MEALPQVEGDPDRGREILVGVYRYLLSLPAWPQPQEQDGLIDESAMTQPQAEGREN